MEALGKLLRRELPSRIQANSASDIRSAIALSNDDENSRSPTIRLAKLSGSSGDFVGNRISCNELTGIS
jgi:hypothetical protein